MPAKEQPSNDKATNAATMPHQLFHGTTWHSRLLPSVHKFAYPYRYWGVNFSALAAGQALPEVNASVSNKLLNRLPFNKILAKALPLFSAQHRALQQFYPADYLQEPEKKNANSVNETTSSSTVNKIDDDVNPVQALMQRLNQAFIHHTGSAPTGDIMGMLVCRNVGIYFSPVNFYLGFDEAQTPTHLLAEVSNTPWDKRHYYGFLLDGAETEFCHDKDFHVSPFNPIDQLYRWQVSVKQEIGKNAAAKREVGKDKVKTKPNNGLQVRIAINISDERGEVLKTGIKMTGEMMTAQSIQQSLKKNPLMNMTSLSRIYWHAFKLYAIKKVPYINYDEKLADSQQQEK
ncbi:DUF1365 domain-containing protein [Psychrobacter jeotgali]|uniref:DUF1365 domain-containing protein n=1 Tax=Psychrobacter jeotgali TaxID=179010 RepID=UPI001919614A|nr:DUF1365 family protein [Psychrobacter jeotgali]